MASMAKPGWKVGLEKFAVLAERGCLGRGKPAYVRRMMRAAFALAVLATPALAGQAETISATNPAYSQSIMLGIVQTQLQRDHDPALDTDTPEHLATRAVAQGIAECAAELRADPSIAAAFAGLDRRDTTVAWDAYNTACADHKTSRGACISAEVGAARAIKHLMSAGSAPVARTLVQACELVLVADPAMADWRQCVDLSLASHPSAERAAQCKLSANWHAARTGAEAGALLGACLSK